MSHPLRPRKNEPPKAWALRFAAYALDCALYLDIPAGATKAQVAAARRLLKKLKAGKV